MYVYAYIHIFHSFFCNKIFFKKVTGIEEIFVCSRDMNTGAKGLIILFLLSKIHER